MSSAPGGEDPLGAAVASAAEALRRGSLAILPTETVYGLAADAGNAQAVAKIFEAKGRPRFNPLIAHVRDLAMAERLCLLDHRAQRLGEAFWPGPLTLVAPYRPDGGICELVRAGLDTIAIRVPNHPLALAVLEGFGGALAAPSANRSGRPSPTTFADAWAETGAAAAAGLDGGPCAVGLESAVVSLLPGEPARLLRSGGLVRAAIEAIIGPLEDGAEGAARSPGRMTLHYAPETPLRINVAKPRPEEIYLGFGPLPVCEAVCMNLSPAGDLREAAANLFALLRAADRRRPSAIAVAPIPSTGLGEAINDRLERAAGRIG